MSLKKFASEFRWRLDWYNGVLKPGPPYFINVEPTNICNLQCTICSMDKSRKPGYMNIEMLNDIIKQASEFKIKEVRLFLAGEPLLNKNLPNMVDIAKRAGMITTIHTNATRLNRQLGKSLIAAGLDLLSISFHGEQKEEYETVMKGADYEKVLENVLNFLKYKLKGKHNKPKVIIQVVKGKMAPSSELSNTFKEKFKGLPVNRFIVLEPHNWAGEIDLSNDMVNRTYYYHCQHLYQSMSVTYNGDVVACCGDLNGRMVIDNVSNKSLKEIWHSEKLCKMRLDLKKGDYKRYLLCSSCDVLFRKRHPLITDIASLFKLKQLINRMKSH